MLQSLKDVWKEVYIASYVLFRLYNKDYVVVWEKSSDFPYKLADITNSKILKLLGYKPSVPTRVEICGESHVTVLAKEKKT